MFSHHRIGFWCTIYHHIATNQSFFLFLFNNFISKRKLNGSNKKTISNNLSKLSFIDRLLRFTSTQYLTMHLLWITIERQRRKIEARKKVTWIPSSSMARLWSNFTQPCTIFRSGTILILSCQRLKIIYTREQKRKKKRI